MQRPFGFMFGPDGRLWPDPRERAVVDVARWLRSHGHTLHQIADELTRRGYANRAGGRFLSTQVHRMLKRDAAWPRL